jgi:hypothetical protein
MYVNVYCNHIAIEYIGSDVVVAVVFFFLSNHTDEIMMGLDSSLYQIQHPFSFHVLYKLFGEESPLFFAMA